MEYIKEMKKHKKEEKKRKKKKNKSFIFFNNDLLSQFHFKLKQLKTIKTQIIKYFIILNFFKFLLKYKNN